MKVSTIPLRTGFVVHMSRAGKIYGFHPYTRNSTLLCLTQVNWFREHSASFWRLELEPDSPPTCPLRPVIPKNTCPPPSYRGCWHGVSRGFFLESCHDRALDERALQAALPFFTHAILLDRAFAHCPRFPTAAPRGSPGRVSVPVWLIIRKDQLSIIGLVSLYLTNYLILRRLIKQRF
ncbi:hypothetical protein IEQ34_025054 [Dendrobium chrysotoxum]|uniref:Uncharacterized protein n=1 Tax=Dendrobium chrysotoxum TaxID=161865 RepID=A0AAV7FJ59_DENCH|nr:hypothetical protein IEQ34_025054 [Dendrobium chrysotoxum]